MSLSMNIEERKNVPYNIIPLTFDIKSIKKDLNPFSEIFIYKATKNILKTI